MRGHLTQRHVIATHDMNKGGLAKRCPDCDRALPLSAFRATPRGRFRVASLCKPCERIYQAAWRQKKRTEDHEWREREKATQRAWSRANPEKVRAQGRRGHLRFQYDMSPDDYDQMLASQNGCCAICGRDGKRFYVDHDHKTKRVRGIICNGCNVLLGVMESTPSRLRAAERYLIEKGSIRWPI